MSGIEELLNGDLSYFDEFYNQTKRQIFFNIFSILKDEQLSEDALQETYVKFLNNLSKLDPKQDILGYLFVISRNIALDMIKKRKKEVQISEYELNNIKEDKKEVETNDLLVMAKKILKDKEFEILILHVINEYSHKEIAAKLNKPIGTITWAYNNAIKKLQKGLKNYE